MIGGRGTGSGLNTRSSAFLSGIRNANLRAAFASINDAYGEKNAKVIWELFKKAPEHVKEAWEMYGDRFVFENLQTGTGSFNTRTNRIRINISRYETDTYQKAYEVVFHEAGHAIDKFMSGNDPSAHFSNSINLSETLEKEFAGNLENYALSKGLEFGESSLQANSPLIKGYVGELRGSLTKYEASNVSDMLEPLTGIDYPLDTGHGNGYWGKGTSGFQIRHSTEAFAEIQASEVANPESLKAIQRLFPKTYETYRQSLTTTIRRKKNER